MNLSKENQEKLTLAIQAGLSIVIIGLSVYNSASLQETAMKKNAKKHAKQLQKLQSNEIRLRTKLMKEKYKRKLKATKKARFLL